MSVSEPGSRSADKIRLLLLKWLAILGFSFYLAWNFFWLYQKQIPPSILLGVFGIPAPTTGMTRSTLAFLHGDILKSLRWNPLTFPILLLFIYSLQLMLTNLIRKRRRVLSTRITRSWIICLLLAWGWKLSQGPTWW